VGNEHFGVRRTRFDLGGPPVVVVDAEEGTEEGAVDVEGEGEGTGGRATGLRREDVMRGIESNLVLEDDDEDEGLEGRREWEWE